MTANPIFDLKNNRDQDSLKSSMEFLWSENGDISADDIAFLGFDCETTGLDHDNDLLIQIGMVAFTSDYTPVSYFESVVFEGGALNRYRAGKIHPAAAEMHKKNGLWEKLARIDDNDYHHEFIPGRVEQQAIAWLETLGIADKRLPMLGSSITFDRTFLAKYMPDLLDKFHYRSVDASSLVTVAANAAEIEEGAVKSLAHESRKGSEEHTCVSDILTSAANIVASIDVVCSTVSDDWSVF